MHFHIVTIVQWTNMDLFAIFVCTVHFFLLIYYLQIALLLLIAVAMEYVVRMGVNAKVIFLALIVLPVQRTIIETIALYVLQPQL